MQQRNPISSSDGASDHDGAALGGPAVVHDGRGVGAGHGDDVFANGVPVGEKFDEWVAFTAKLWSMRDSVARKMLQGDMKTVRREIDRNGFFARLATVLANVSVERAALRIGCHRSTLYRKLKGVAKNQ